VAIPAGPALDKTKDPSMKTMTALALVIASAPAAYAASPLNESFIDQIGTKNTATIAQQSGNNGQSTFQAGKKNSVTTGQLSQAPAGKNTSGNVQVGNKNTATTVQENTPPNSQFTTAPYANNSFSAQYGVKNDVTLLQTGGQNSQGTVQAGKKNESLVSQSDQSVTSATASPVGGANTSFTGQFGNKNTATTSQKSADGTTDFGGFETGHGNASSSVQIGDRNVANTDQKSVGANAGQGVNNAAASLQVGKDNIENTTQGGHVAGAFGDTTADQTANYTNASLVGQVGVKNDAEIDQKNGANTQATFQTGNQNSALINQTTKPAGTGNGSNNAVTAQFGVKNQAIVNQSMAVPLAVGENNSFITQIGGNNVVNSAQSVGAQAVAGNNTQVAMQYGIGNSVNVTQATGANVANTSFTAQYGSHNTAVVSQK
jgi:hypothetical protein